MKIFYIWIALGIAEIIASIVLFVNHKSISVLILSLVMCSLTIAGVIRTTANNEDWKIYQRAVITSFIGCIIVGGYFHALVWPDSNFFGVTFYTGILCLPVLLLDKESKTSINSLLGDCVKRMFVCSNSPDGCFVNIIVGLFGCVLSVCIGVLFMLISYAVATAKLLRANVDADNDLSSVLEKLNADLLKKHSDLPETESVSSKDDGDWL